MADMELGDAITAAMGYFRELGEDVSELADELGVDGIDLSVDVRNGRTVEFVAYVRGDDVMRFIHNLDGSTTK